MDFFCARTRLHGVWRQEKCTAILQQILERRDLESRHYLQTHHSLRELRVAPPQGEEKQVLGVVEEVGMNGGADLVVGYADHHARHYNYSGAAIVWERPNDTLDEATDELSGAAAQWQR